MSGEMTWSKAEKVAARRAFDGAYLKECAALASRIRKMAVEANEPADIWRIHDLLTEQRDLTDEKYDYRYSRLIFVFARLLKDGWLSEDDLEGLSQEKLEKIGHLADL